MTDLIEQIAKARGIADEYVAADGSRKVISRESKKDCLRALGYDVDDDASLLKQFNSQEDELYDKGVEPVIVAFENEGLSFKIRLTDDEAKDPLSFEVTKEDGTKCQGPVLMTPSAASEKRTVHGLTYTAYDAKVPIDLPCGYHEIAFKTRKRTISGIRLIVCPKSCYKPPRIQEGLKVWGPSVQLYALRSARNWGIGDFSDLAELIKYLADNGAGFVGINPIHAAYPSNPESASPYSPSSRRWLNVIYINVEDTQEYNENEDVRRKVCSIEFQKKLNQLRTAEYVDYAGVMKLKLETLRDLFAGSTISDGRSRRGKAFTRFCNEGGLALYQMATYDALQEYLYNQGKQAWGWPVWPAIYQKYTNTSVKNWQEKHEADIKFYMFLQFLADEQLEKANKVAQDRGMAVGIYRDLAVGVSSGSEELWANGGIYCTKASVGAPPDPLGPLGQNWGLPPMDPQKLLDEKYQPMIDLFRSNMRHCGSLRIDHAMSLYRLWWVPPAAPASEGVYVYYRVKELVGILALESHRNKCLIIGEDLGTVPDEMRAILKDAGIHSYRIFFWEKAQDGGYLAPKDYPEQAMSALSTHDMPTILGWWNHEDLKLGLELGLYNEQQAHDIGEGRYHDQQRILDSLHGLGSVGDKVPSDGRNCPMSPELLEGLQIHMCRGSCALFSTQIEDWIRMEKPVNVPGTSSEYPNWRRKITKNLDEIFSDPEVLKLLHEMTEARNSVSAHY